MNSIVHLHRTQWKTTIFHNFRRTQPSYESIRFYRRHLYMALVSRHISQATCHELGPNFLWRARCLNFASHLPASTINLRPSSSITILSLSPHAAGANALKPETLSRSRRRSAPEIYYQPYLLRYDPSSNEISLLLRRRSPCWD